MKKYILLITLLFPALSFSQINKSLFDSYLTLFISIDNKIVSPKEICAVYLTFKDSLNNTFNLNCYYYFGKLYYSKEEYDEIKNKKTDLTYTFLYKNHEDKDSIYVYEVDLFRSFLPYYFEINNINSTPKSYYYLYTVGGFWGFNTEPKKTIILPPNYPE